MAKKSPLEKKSPLARKSSENSPINLSKMKERKCIQPAVLAIRTAALLERPPTPTPGSSPSIHGCREQFLAPIYIPNKLLGNQNGNNQLPKQPQRHSTSRIREINPIAKAELRGTYRNTKADMAAGLPAVEHTSFPKLSNEDVKVHKRATFLPKIEQANQQTLTGIKHESFHAITQHEHQLYRFKRSPLGRLEGNSFGSEIRLPATKSKHRTQIHKKTQKSDSRRTESSSLSPSPAPAQDNNSEFQPKPPSVPKTTKTSKHIRRQKARKDELDSENQPSNLRKDSFS